jgi:hypothetical protein
LLLCLPVFAAPQNDSGPPGVDCQIGEGSPFLGDQAMVARLWTTTETIVASHLDPHRREAIEHAQDGQAAHG